MPNPPDANGLKKKEVLSQEDLAKLISLLETTRFGSITLVIQDGKIVQIERNEKIRLV